MRLSLPFTLLLCTCGSALIAQAAPDQVITKVFTAMRAADTTGLRSHFHPAADLYSVTTLPSGETKLAEGDLNKWFEGIAGADAGAWDERTAYIETRTDGHLATAWVPYAFYYAGELHHCGVNAIQFVKSEDNWRILHITDTRRDALRRLPGTTHRP